jgi:hypothetical protein
MDRKLTRTDALKALDELKKFIGPSQLDVLRRSLYGEEREWFYGKLTEMANLIRTMPKSYEQDGLGDNAVVFLHYFSGGCDWWITEKDAGVDQVQAFGLADIGYGGELGYIPIVEITSYGAELDLHFDPKTLASVRAEKRAAA